MASIITIILIGISLSMDAFSLSLAYGISGINKKRKVFLSITVGIYHFIMPLIGMLISTYIKTHTFINLKFFSTAVLIYLGINFFFSKEDLNPAINDYFIFGLSVSIDSLIVGVTLREITNNYLFASTTFSIISSSLTYLGLTLGNIISNKIGNYSKKIGGILLIIIALILYNQ